ncbi:MAG: enoyl-CoA hydratase/isomerase family protein [Sulfobacillus thermosulfidooxidans]|nr:MAG: enoyl-CoA hydratase/isomerase family protein [Sulfobacillus thermosulfidooxidans]
MNNIEVESGAISRIWLNRPAVRNALNGQTIQELIGTFERLGQDPTVHVIILSARGEKAFCAGADLNEVATLRDVESVRTYFSLMAQLIETIRSVKVPVIGAAFGYTLAGGMGLAAACDILIVADNGSFGLPEVKIGLFPMVVMAPIAQLIGPRRTLELALTGRIISAQELHQWGFFNQLVPFSLLQDKAWEVADAINQGSPFIAQMGKEAWRHIQGMDTPQAMDYLKNMVSLVALSEDSREGILAFQEKRSPRWPSAQ